MGRPPDRGDPESPEWGCAPPVRGADTFCEPMHDPIRDADTLAEAEDHLLAADTADMHRLLVWYYGADEANGQHLPYPHVEDQAA